LLQASWLRQQRRLTLSFSTTRRHTCRARRRLSASWEFENFDTRSGGFSTDYGTSGVITGTYSGGGLQILPADQYGGAGGAGKYIVAFTGTSYTLTLVNDPSKNPDGINYFGYWLSALDAGNQVVFKKSRVQVGALTLGDVLAQVSGQPAYFGNPNPAFWARTPASHTRSSISTTRQGRSMRWILLKI
jgi:hypothetical protein